MKALLLIATTLTLALGVAGQGTDPFRIDFRNIASTSFKAPIYGPENDDPLNPTELHANTVAGGPPGSTVYTGRLLEGSGYTAELWYGEFQNQLRAASGSQRPFGTGTSAGYWIPALVPVTFGVPPERIYWEVRVWGNRGGAIDSWATVLADPTVLRGSAAGSIDCRGALCDPTASPPPLPALLLGLTSFNVHPATGHVGGRLAAWVVAGGGGPSAGGGFTLNGTVGQADAGVPLSGGVFSMAGGFWPEAAGGGRGSSPSLAIRHGSGNTIILTWPNPSTGYVLQQTANVTASGGGWLDVTQPPVIVGSNWQVTLQATGRFCLFRLRKL